MDLLFNDSYGLKINARKVAEEVERFIESDDKFCYVVTVGTDSERLSDKTADFVTAIVVRRVGNGGRYFWRRTKHGPYHTLRDRIIQEVMLSLDTAREILARLKEIPGLDFSFEVHVDVGEGGETKAMITEVVGMIRAHNFEAKTKPESYAATSVADKHV